jgi:ankyrin repeat protein
VQANDSRFRPRYTQYVLKEILSEGYESLRPRDRDRMRVRVQCLRKARLTSQPKRSNLESVAQAERLRPPKASLHEDLGSTGVIQHSQSYQTPDSIKNGAIEDVQLDHNQSFSERGGAALQIVCHGGNGSKGSYADLSNSFGAERLDSKTKERSPHKPNHDSKTLDEDQQAALSLSKVHSESITASLTGDNYGEKKAPVKLSWVIAQLDQTERNDSWYIDVRSLLSGLSLSSSRRSSISSQSSLLDPTRTSITSTNALRTLDSPGTDDGWIPAFTYEQHHNKRLIESCCGLSRDCFHRRVAAAIQSQGKIFRVKGADVDAVDTFGDTILHIAARWGASLQIFEQILALGPHTNRTNHRGETFLHHLGHHWIDAWEGALEKLISMVTSTGFSSQLRDCHGKTWLNNLLMKKFDIIDEHSSLIKESSQAYYYHLGKIDSVLASLSNFPKTESILHCLSDLYSDTDISQKMYDHGLMMPKRNQTTWCIAFGGTAAQDILDLSSISPRVKDSDDLHSRNLRGASYKLSDIMTNGADVNSYNRSGETCIMVLLKLASAELGSFQIFRKGIYEKLIIQLLEAGADPRKEDEKGNTALHLAASLALPTMVHILLDHGADHNLVNQEQKKPLDLAKTTVYSSKKRNFPVAAYVRSMRTIIQLSQAEAKPDTVQKIVKARRKWTHDQRGKLQAIAEDD